jgi:hypothetical protein
MKSTADCSSTTYLAEASGMTSSDNLDKEFDIMEDDLEWSSPIESVGMDLIVRFADGRSSASLPTSFEETKPDESLNPDQETPSERFRRIQNVITRANQAMSGGDCSNNGLGAGSTDEKAGQHDATRHRRPLRHLVVNKAIIVVYFVFTTTRVIIMASRERSVDAVRSSFEHILVYLAVLLGVILLLNIVVDRRVHVRHTDIV